MGEPAEALDEDLDFEMVTALRVDGPPLRFRGRLIAEASNEHLDRPAYSELRIYERQRGGYVAAVSVRRGALGVEDLHVAQTCETFADALDAMESVDPTSAWREPPTIAARHGAAKLIAIVALRLKLERVREDHQALMERTASLWATAPAPAALFAAYQDREIASARLAIQPPRG